MFRLYSTYNNATTSLTEHIYSCILRVGLILLSDSRKSDLTETTSIPPKNLNPLAKISTPL